MAEEHIQVLRGPCGRRRLGQGAASYFVYRDLGMKSATEGRVMAHVIRAAQSCDGPMGYHSTNSNSR